MGFVEDMKWWHWVVVSVVVGTALAYINANMRDLPPTYASMDTTDFERNLIKSPVGPNRQPWITNVMIYPPAPFQYGDGTVLKQVVTFNCLVVPEDHPKDAGVQSFTMVAPIPYEAAPRWAVGAYGDRAYPGAMIYLAKRGDTLASVTKDHYGKDTPEGEDAIINANELLRTAPSRGMIRFRPFFMYFVPYNPALNRTVVDFLNDASKEGIQVTYHTAWWEAPQYVYEAWIGGSVLVIGIIWPGLLLAMKKGGLGRVHTATYDLSRFKPAKATSGSGSEPVKEAVGITAAGIQQVHDLATNMEESLRTSGRWVGRTRRLCQRGRRRGRRPSRNWRGRRRQPRLGRRRRKG